MISPHTKTQDTDLAVRRAQFEHALAVLTGKSPAEFSLPPKAIVDPPVIPVGLPSTSSAAAWTRACC